MYVQGKRLSSKDTEEVEEEDEEDEDDADGTDVTSGKLQKAKSSTLEGGEKSPSGKKKKSLKTHPDLSNITYLGTGKVKGFTPEISSSIPADMMCSYAEPKTMKLAKNPDKVDGWIDHNRKHLR